MCISFNVWFVIQALLCAAPAYANDPALHARVRVQLVNIDHGNEMDMMSIVMRINR